jgi:hypothetical protein
MASHCKCFSTAWLNTCKWFFTSVGTKVSRQRYILSKRLSASSFRTYEWFFTSVRSKVFRQIVFARKRLSTASLSTQKWFFARMPSKMDNQCCSRRKIFATAWLSTSVSFRQLLLLLLLAHTRVIHAIADCIISSSSLTPLLRLRFFAGISVTSDFTSDFATIFAVFFELILVLS